MKTTALVLVILALACVNTDAMLKVVDKSLKVKGGRSFFSWFSKSGNEEYNEQQKQKKQQVVKQFTPKKKFNRFVNVNELPWQIHGDQILKKDTAIVHASSAGFLDGLNEDVITFGTSDFLQAGGAAFNKILVRNGGKVSIFYTIFQPMEDIQIYDVSGRTHMGMPWQLNDQEYVDSFVKDGTIGYNFPDQMEYHLSPKISKIMRLAGWIQADYTYKSSCRQQIMIDDEGNVMTDKSWRAPKFYVDYYTCLPDTITLMDDRTNVPILTGSKFGERNLKYIQEKQELFFYDSQGIGNNLLKWKDESKK